MLNGEPDPTLGKYAWHIHHEVLLERVCCPMQERIDYIKSDKPQHEVATRLHLLRLVQDQDAAAAHDDEVTRLGQERYDRRQEVRAAYVSTGHARAMGDFYAVGTSPSPHTEGDGCEQAYHTALREFQRENDEAVQAAVDKLNALHKAECDPECPWDGLTIFPVGGKLWSDTLNAWW